MNIQSTSRAQRTPATKAAPTQEQKQDQQQAPKESLSSKISESFETYAPYAIGAGVAPIGFHLGAYVGVAVYALSGSVTAGAYAGIAGAALGAVGAATAGIALAPKALNIMGQIGEGLTSNPAAGRALAQAAWTGATVAVLGSPLEALGVVGICAGVGAASHYLNK